MQDQKRVSDYVVSIDNQKKPLNIDGFLGKLTQDYIDLAKFNLGIDLNAPNKQLFDKLLELDYE